MGTLDGDRETLMSTLPPDVRDDAERMLDSQPEVDPHAVVKALHAQGLIRDDQLRKAVLALEQSLKVGLRARPPTEAAPDILGPLGAGAMGEVLLAKDHGLNRVVAIKRIHAELASRGTVLDRFYREAQVTAQLDHPSIVPIHSLVQDGKGGLAYTMKLVQGRTFEDYLDDARTCWRKKKPEPHDLALPARLEIFLHVCEAIGYAHEKGVLHRDLKPENIMVGTFSQVLVMDWGIAKVLERADAHYDEASGQPAPMKTTATRVGAVMGTPRYMSPEQAEGKNDTIDARSDQYTLGLILQEVVTLKPAVSGDIDLEGCLQWAKAARRTPMTHLASGAVPRELVAIVDKACQLAPAGRYRTVSELAADIRRYLRDEAVTAKPDTMGQRIGRWVGRHRSLMVTLLLSSLLLFVGTTSLLVVAGVGALAWRQQVASAREAALTEVLGSVSHGAGEIDGFLRAIEGVATGLSYAAEVALEQPGDGTGLALPYDPLVDGPRGRRSERYGRQISVSSPSLRIDARSSGPEVDAEARKLVGMGYQYARALVDSTGQGIGEKSKRRDRFERISKEGAPVLWARIVTTHGVMGTLPGFEEPPARGDDPRAAAWFGEAQKSGLVWSGPAIDDHGMGAVVTVALPLWDGHQEPLGVAAADLGLDPLAEKLRAHSEGLAKRLGVGTDAVDAFLVDGEGHKIVVEGMNAAKLDKWAPGKVSPALLAAIKRRPEGLRDGERGTEAWAPVGSAGWTYVVVVPSL